MTAVNQQNDGGKQENDGGKQLAELQNIATLVNTSKRANRTMIQQVLLRLCAIQPLSIQRLAELTNRKPRTLQEHLSKLVNDGYLAYTYPDNLKHKNQAYCITQKGQVKI